jgi:voltage-gated potassium channel Kch
VNQQANLHRGGAGKILTRTGFDAASSNQLTDTHHEIEAKAFVQSRDRAFGAQLVAQSSRSQKVLDSVAQVALLWASWRRFPT